MGFLWAEGTQSPRGKAVREGCSVVSVVSAASVVLVLRYLADGSKSVCLSLAAELEFVQIIIIVVVMMVMVVVITCLLNHYKLSARSFISRHSQGRRRDENLSSVSHTLLFQPHVLPYVRPWHHLSVLLGVGRHFRGASGSLGCCVC